MNRWTRYLPALLLASAAIGFFASPAIRGYDGPAAVAEAAEAVLPQSSFTELNRQYRLIGQILNEISRSYYQEVDIRDVSIGSLKGMMAELDPYSEFYVEEQDEGEVADLENTLTGTYSGIGATIGPRNGELSIVAPMRHSPAERSGLQAGDIIVRINEEPSRHFEASDAAKRIKGPKGTPVTLTIEREGFPDPFEVTIIRDDIEVNDVATALFVEPGIAYIEIARFSRLTGRFLDEALDELEQQQPIEGLILDLRGNPGGLLDQALAVLEPFIPAGELVVYTEGRISQMNARFHTREKDRYAGRMAILVNRGSASASEIVAGAMQDLDRAVIVGETTFGKGLVQSVAELDRGMYLRLTTGEYFTPSGRSLQRTLVENDRGQLTVPAYGAPDTLEHPAFRSRNGRLVTGGGGVVPDIEADSITGNVLLVELKFFKGMFLRYVNNYVNTRHTPEGSAVAVDDRLLDDFQQWCEEQGFEFTTPTEMRLADLRRTAESEKISDGLSDEIEALERAIAVEKDRMWDRSRESIALELRREFTTRLKGYGEGQMVYFEADDQFQAALRVLRDPAAYAGLLSPAVMGDPAVVGRGEHHPEPFGAPEDEEEHQQAVPQP